MSALASIPCWFAIIVLLVCSCTSTSKVSKQKIIVERSDPFKLAKQLIQLRQHKKAIGLLEQHLRHDPENIDTLFMTGNAYFAIASYDQAAGFFRRVLLLSPQHIDAKHRLWAARLQADYSNAVIKKKIRSEIEGIFTRDTADPQEKLTAYYGYRYLWDQKNQQRAIKIVVVQKLSNQLRERVAGALVYEIITARNKAIRTELAELYLDHFPEITNDAIAASWLFSSSVINKNLQRLETNIEKYTGSTRNNVAANLYAAHALLRNEHKLLTVISLLQDNLAFIKKIKPGSQNEPELATNYRLLGIAYYKQRKFRLARKNLKQAIKLHPEHGRAAYYLGKIAENSGNRGKAIALYRKSLEADGRQTGVQDVLGKLLENNLENKTPSQFFANQERIIVFKDVTKAAGLDNVSSHRVAWGDYDNDGDDDLLVNGSRLFRNNRGIFTDVTDVLGIPRITNATGGLWGDFNNDGYVDIFVTVKGTNRLLENIGGKGFAEVSSKTLPKNNSAWSEAAAWGDYNGDGYLDLYIANYQLPAVERGICSHDSLLENIHGRQFVLASHMILPLPDEAMCGRGVTWADFNDDGKLDIFVANYRLDPNFLWLKKGKQFTESAGASSVAGNNIDGYYGNSIGSVFSDFDNNGEIDLFVANLAHPRDLAFSDKSHLYLQTRGRFHDYYNNSGVGFEETYSDPAAADIDNDGDIDLFVSAIYSSGQSHLFLNDGKGNFRDVSWLSQARLKNTWGGAFSDYDNDGDMDLVVTSKDGIRLLRNDGPGGHWLKISLRSKHCNTFGIGARIEIQYQNQSQSRVITAGRGTGNQDSLTQLFGLGVYQGPVELNLKDGCGHTFRRNLPDIDRHYVLRY